MNAKELREAAQRLIDDLKLWEAEHRDLDVVELADYILATVRDDDDAGFDSRSDAASWLESIGSVEMNVNVSTWYVFPTCETKDVEIEISQKPCDSGGYGLIVQINGTELPWVMKRGQFRSLCRGLGIELKGGGK